MAVVTRACSTMMRHFFRQVTSHVRNLSILTPVRPTCVVLKGKVVCEMNTVSQWRRWYGSESGGLTEEALNLETVRVLKLFDKVDPNKVTLESHFINDLGLDSLDSVEIVMAFEDEFGVEISDEEAEKIFTCKDAVEILKVKLDIQ